MKFSQFDIIRSKPQLKMTGIINDLKSLFKNRKTGIIIVPGIVAILFVCLFLIINQKNTAGSMEEFRKIVEATKGEIPINIVDSFYDKIGPDALIKVIEEDNYCHEKGHNVGRVIYRKNKDLSLSLEKCSYRCTTGCFHGVLMEYFKKGESDEPHIRLEDVKNEISEVCDSKEVTGNKIQKGVCIHGVGHALAFLAKNDIGLALKYCESFKDEGPVYYCATGVFMEWDIVNGRRYKNSSNLFPCDKFDFPSACFRYKLARTFGEDELLSARNFCAGITDPELRSACFHGLGFRFFRLLKTNPLKYVCDVADSGDEKMCIEGAIGVLSAFDEKRAFGLCEELSGENKEACFTAARQSNFGMDKDFSDYFIYLNH